MAAHSSPAIEPSLRPFLGRASVVLEQSAESLGALDPAIADRSAGLDARVPYPVLSKYKIVVQARLPLAITLSRISMRKLRCDLRRLTSHGVEGRPPLLTF